MITLRISFYFMRLYLILFALFLPACTAYYTDHTDKQVQTILDQRHGDLLSDRHIRVRYPDSTLPQDTQPAGSLNAGATQSSEDAESSGESAEASPNQEPQAVRKISLKEALEIAFQTNRQYLSEKDSLYISVLSLINARHTFSPQLSAILSYLYSDGSGVERDQETGLGLGLSQNLPYGGSLSLNADSSFLDSGDSSLADRRAFSSSLGVSLSQPLLRGAGREVAMNSLIQAEHNLVYEIRGFELFRQGFSIDVARRYYDLVRQSQSITNERNNLESFEFTRNQAEAFFKVGRTNELDVLRARRSLLNSQNRLIEAEEGYLLSLDRFKIFLGLPTTVEIEIIPVEPDFMELHYEIRSCIEVALANRLDLMSRKEQVEDAARSLRISENGLLPDLNLDLNYNLSGNTDASFGNQRLDNRSYSAGVSLELPFDRVRERTALVQSQIGYEQSLRSFQEFKDNLVIEIHSAFRELERRRQSLEIQRKIISDEEKNAMIAEIRVRRGEIPNRDLVEAQLSLLQAQNNLINEKVDYEITRLELLKDLGILFIDEQGMWDE